MDSSCPPRYTFRILKEEDYSIVWKIVVEEFNKREPSSIVLGLSLEECEIVHGQTIQMSLKDHVSIGAFCQDSNTLAGCIISQLGKNVEVNDSMSNLESAPMKVKQFFAIETPLLEPGMSDILGTDNYMYSSVVVCRQQDSGNGIATELLTRSIEVAKAAECRKYLILAFNYYLQRIARKLGFKTEKEVYFKDFVDPYTQELIYAGVPEPHTVAARVVKTL